VGSPETGRLVTIVRAAFSPAFLEEDRYSAHSPVVTVVLNTAFHA
jgi:hypothetical protein